MRKPKHREILDVLLREIGSGQYRDGQQIPTEIDLAERFRVSRPTVCRAVQELSRLGLVHRRAGSGTFVRQAVASGQKVFGLLVPELGDSEIFEPICSHIARIIQKQGHVLQWADTNGGFQHRETAETARQACRGFIDRGVSGVFFAPFVTPPGTENPNRSIVESLHKAGIAVVLLDRDIVAFPERSALDLVSVDHVRGQAQMTEHLLSLGRRRIGFWLWKNAADTLHLRAAGFLRGMALRNLHPGDEPLVACNPDDVAQVSHLLKSQRPDAIMCANDIFAAHLMKSLEQLHVRIPEDVCVTGYDDVRYAHLLRVPLTTLSQPCEDIGKTAVRLMLERLDQPDLPGREVLVAARLTVRESTQPTHAAASATVVRS